jgi:hypothetical protein
MQEGKLLAFYSIKLNSAQTSYTTGEQELISVVETLKEFRDIFLGQQAIVHTGHLNILYGNLSNDRIIRWRLLLEEYGPKYVHIAGKNNIFADVPYCLVGIRTLSGCRPSRVGEHPLVTYVCR